MDILLMIFAIAGGVVALVLVAALFVKRDYVIRREIVIRRPVEEVFNYLRHLKNQEEFSKWVMTDPDMKKEIRGRDGTVGCVYAWDGNQKAGKGEQEITGIQDCKRIDVEVRFEKPFKSTARTPIITERLTENETKVTWGMEGRSNYPLNLMTAMISGVLRKDLETSLANLKRNLEKREPVTLK